MIETFSSPKLLHVNAHRPYGYMTQSSRILKGNAMMSCTNVGKVLECGNGIIFLNIEKNCFMRGTEEL